MTALTPPDARARSFIVLLSLLQGLLLWVAQTGIEQGFWPFSELSGRVCWYTLVLTVPGMMSLTVVRLDDRRFWQHVAGGLLLFGALAAWASWSATGDPELRADRVLAPFGFTVALGWFIALPWLQIRLEHGRFAARYDELFEHAWQNTLVLILTAVFTGLCWGVLMLCAELFELVGIDFFRELFRKPAFGYLATGVMVGLGILIGRVQPNAVRVARQILLAIFKGLLPMLAVVALMFLAALPFTGLEPLWKTRFAAGTLCMLVALFVLFANAVFQDGNIERPYPALLRRVVEAALVAMPVFALIALYAMWLRIAQYGWTQDRVWAALAGLVLLAYAAGYAASVLRPRERWLAGVERVNVVVSLVILALVVAANSPLLDPHGITARSQVARLSASNANAFDASHLRFDSGRRGVAALRALTTDARVTADPALAKRIDSALAQRLPRWERQRENEPGPTAADFAARVILPPGVAAAPDDLYQAFARGEGGSNCESDRECVLLDPDLDGDGTSEYVLCAIARDTWVSCSMWRRLPDGWKQSGSMAVAGGEFGKVAADLRAGKFSVQPSPWQELHIGSARYEVDEN